MRSVAKWLVLGESTHANPRGFLLWLDFERLAGGFKDFSHVESLGIEMLTGDCEITHAEGCISGSRFPA